MQKMIIVRVIDEINKVRNEIINYEILERAYTE
jgi:hypothetical protein